MKAQDTNTVDFSQSQDEACYDEKSTDINRENNEDDTVDGALDVVIGGKVDQEKGYLLAASKRQEIKDLDEILPVIGEYDRYQILQTILLSFFMINTALHYFSYYFLTLQSPWRCTQHGVNSSECTGNETISEKHESFEQRCQMNRSSWMFVNPKKYSLETEFELVCDKDVFLTVVKCIGFVGAIVGSWVIGILSDKYGRKPLLHISFIIVQLTSLIESFAPNIELSIISRFFNGFVLAGVISLVFTMLVELAGPKTRAKTAISIWIAFSIGLCVLALKAYYIADWRNLTRLISGPYLLLLLLWKVIPESFRWLRIHQKTKHAEKILGIIAKLNKKPYPDVKVQELHSEECTARFKEIFLDAKRSSTLIHQIVIWLIHHVITYGITAIASHMTNKIHLGMIISSLVDIPAVLLSIYVCNKFGRRKAISLGTFPCAILLIVVTFLKETPRRKLAIHVARTLCGLLAKFFISVSYYSIQLYSNELHPTVLRSRAVMSIISIASMGGASAPWIIIGLNKMHERIPFAVLSVLSLVAGILSTRLEETKDMHTQEIIPRARKSSVLRINKLVDNVRDSYSMCSRASSENRLSIIDQKQSITTSF